MASPDWNVKDKTARRGREDALYETEPMCCFAKGEVAEHASADENSILLFRRLLEAH